MIKNRFSLKKNLIYLIFLFGIVHWFFFWYSSDYYSYNDIKPKSSFELDDNQIKSYNFESLKNKDFNFKGDKDLIKKIVNEKKLKIKKLFTFSEFTSHDWYKEHSYQNVLSYSLKNKIIPFHVPNFDEIFIGDERFFSNPIYTLSPQILLLKFFDSNVFSILNLFFMFSLGFIGCLLIKREYKLNIQSFIFLFILFNFNGYFITKYSNYGASQLGYFLLPFIFYYLMNICIHFNDNNRKNYNSILLGLFLSLILLQGSVHLYVEVITFLLFWSIFNFKLWKASFIIYLVNFTTSSFRLLPALLSHGLHANPHTLPDQIVNHGGGYGTFEIFVKSLVTLNGSLDYPPAWNEFSMYVSLTGVLLIFLFCFFIYFVDDKKNYFQIWKYFLIPIILIIIISFHKLKFIILPNWIPFFNVESITSRYIIIPFVFLFILSSINLNLFIKFNKNKKTAMIFINSLILVSFFSLMNYSRIWRNNLVISEHNWRISLQKDGSNYLYEFQPIYNLIIQNNYDDKIYIYLVIISLFFSIFAYSYFLFKLYSFNKIIKLYNSKD